MRETQPDSSMPNPVYKWLFYCINIQKQGSRLLSLEFELSLQLKRLQIPVCVFSVSCRQTTGPIYRKPRVAWVREERKVFVVFASTSTVLLKVWNTNWHCFDETCMLKMIIEQVTCHSASSWSHPWETWNEKDWDVKTFCNLAVSRPNHKIRQIPQNQESRLMQSGKKPPQAPVVLAQKCRSSGVQWSPLPSFQNIFCRWIPKLCSFVNTTCKCDGLIASPPLPCCHPLSFS